MRTVTLTRGLPGSGKTTWARQEQSINKNIVVVCKDDLRAMLNNGVWSKANEKLVLDARDGIIIEALLDGRDVIVADTNFEKKHEDHIRDLVEKYVEGVTVKVMNFDTPLEECIARDLKRPNSVGEKVIKRMYYQYIALRPKIERETLLNPAIVCDLDGTLAILNGRNPYDASTCENDLLNENVADIVYTYAGGGCEIIITSGRSDKYREQTEKWLSRYGVDYKMLLMRSHGDMRKDAIIKEEMYRANIKGKFNVAFVLDDREQVVEMWRSLGLTCFQVNEGPD